MSDAIVSGVFGALILAALAYLISRIDRLSDKIDRFGERLAHIEGQLDQHLRNHPADQS